MSRFTTRDRPGIDLALWKRLAADLPDLRWDKVAAAREALRRGRYELTPRLDRILGELHNEIGVLCRREFRLEEGEGTGGQTSR